MLLQSFIHKKAGSCLPMIVGFIERTILYREIGLCPGDD